MKQIRVKINMATGKTKTLDVVTLYEGEQYTTKIIFLFENPIVAGDQFYIEVKPKDPKDEMRIYNVYADASNKKATILLPRIALQRGQLQYTLVRYNDSFEETQKFYPDPLFVSIAGDITMDTLERRPDVFADLNQRLKALEDKLL